MSWKLILSLSLFGLAMAIATVYVIPSDAEPAFWLPIFAISALVVARRAPGQFFLHGFFVGLTNWIWVAGAHIILSDTYLARHVQETAGLKTIPLPDILRRYDLPIPGASGIVIGLLSWVASRIRGVRRPARRPAAT
jgi:hypothetical protein